MPRPRSAKKSVNALTFARSSSCGPISTPSTSSTTTTGTNTPRPPNTAASVPATAAVATMARKDPASTVNTWVAAASGTAARTLGHGPRARPHPERMKPRTPPRVPAGGHDLHLSQLVGSLELALSASPADNERRLRRGDPMNGFRRPGLFALPVLPLLALAGTTLSPDRAPARPASAPTAHNLILGSQGSDDAQPENMNQFLTAVTKDVDRYWTKVFKDSGLPEPKVSYAWIPSGETAASACGDENGTGLGGAAAYCPGDDTMYISQAFATDIYDGALDQALPGSSQGYGRAAGDFAVAYIIAHEYGHEVQDELGAFDQYGSSRPAMAFELQADCYAGSWAKSVSDDGRLEDGDTQEALDAALAVGDFDTSDPGHHGTPEQREQAWKHGFDSGDPAACGTYLE